jgi:ubiquinone/menaquinone biosynthesis C-methylase UbiE
MVNIGLTRQMERRRTMDKKQTNPWYAEEGGFFSSDYFEEYVEDLTPERTKIEVDFLEKELKLRKGAKIFDLACGHGRHTIELAKRGYLMTGQDINASFLKHAKQSAKKAGVEVNWIKSDVRQIPFENEFDIVLNLFTSFGYLESDEEDQKVLYQVAKVLHSNGSFVLDVVNRERIVRIYSRKDWLDSADGTMIITERSFDLIRGRNQEKRIRIYKDGKRQVSSMAIRMYTLPELISMCEKAGFRFISVFGNYNGEDLTLDSKRCILITKKSTK